MPIRPKKLKTKNFGITEFSLQEEISNIIDHAVSTVFKEVTSDWQSEIKHSEQADTLFVSALHSQKFNKALYYRAISYGLNSIAYGSQLTSDDMMRQVVRVATVWKNEANEIIRDLTPDNLEHMEAAYPETVFEGLVDAYKQEEMGWVIVYKAAYKLKKEEFKVTGQ